MYEGRVNRTAKNFAVVGSELIRVLAEVDDFCGTYKGEVQRVEEQNNVFSLVLVQADGLELALEPS